MFPYWRLAAVLPLLLICACATVPAHQALAPDMRDKISSTEVVAPIAQNEIYVFVPSSDVSAAAGGGLLAALVDVGINDARTSHAEDAVRVVRDSLVDFDFDGKFQAGLEPALAQISWLHSEKPRVIKEVGSNNLGTVLKDSQASTVLLVVADYHLSNDGDELFVALTAGLFSRSDALQVRPTGGPPSTWANAFYRNTLTYEAKAPGATGDRDHDVTAWSADKGGPIRAALEQGIAKVQMMMASDLQGRYASETGKSVTVDGIPGQAIEPDDGGSVVRFEDGTLKYARREVMQ